MWHEGGVQKNAQQWSARCRETSVLRLHASQYKDKDIYPCQTLAVCVCKGLSFPVAGLFVAMLRLAGTGRYAELQWDSRPWVNQHSKDTRIDSTCKTLFNIHHFAMLSVNAALHLSALNLQQTCSVSRLSREMQRNQCRKHIWNQFLSV